MALVVSSLCEDKKARKSSSSFRGEKKPWMLKDYLGDDLSSCSSNGFRSFPRRQCCVAVCNIIENEVITRTKIKPPSHTKRMIVKNDCSFSSALQRASMAVVNAVKLIPFHSTPSKNNVGKRFLPRSFSKKLFSRSFFWKKHRSTNSNNVVVAKKKRSKNKHEEYIDEIERWISSGAVGKEKYKPLDLSNDTTVTSVSNSDGKSSDSSWSDITFTSDSNTSFSENDDVEKRENMVEEEEVTKRAVVLAGEDSVQPAVHDEEENVWMNEEAEKEHTSPISVLDFPEDDELGSSSPFTLRASRIKGAKERLMKKLGRFECLVGLEPVNLESLLSSPDLDHRSLECTIQPCSTPSFILSTCVSEQEEDNDEGEEEVFHESQAEKQAQYLLNVTKANVTMPSKITNEFELENVLLDFFRENMTQRGSHALLKTAEDWLNGHYDNLILGWEVKDKRQAYIRDMEEGGWWPRDTNVEREEIADELGDEVMTHLIGEIMVEFCSLS